MGISCICNTYNSYAMLLMGQISVSANRAVLVASYIYRIV